MLVNNIDVATFKGKLLNKDIQLAEITIYDDWLRNALSPLYFGKQEKFKLITLQILIEDTSDENCLIDLGNLIRQFEKCTVKFDDISFYYNCTFASTDHERLQKGYFLLNVKLKSAYAYLPTVTTILAGSSQTITVLGNLPTPAVIILTPSINVASVTITGMEKVITVKNLRANNPIIIDGEQYLVTENGLNKFTDTDMWKFPILQPGGNTISINSGSVAVQIKYKPNFM